MDDGAKVHCSLANSVEKVVILLAIAKGKQLSIFIFLTRVAAGFLPCDVLLAFFRARV